MQMPEFESRMLIDGELTGAVSGAVFDVVDPATEEVVGRVADASGEDVERAIAAARRAFDESEWATDRELRKGCLQQLHEALEQEREQLRAELVNETGTPVLLTYGPQLDAPLSEGLLYPRKLVDDFEWERDLGVQENFGTKSRVKVAKEPVGVVSGIIPWNFPFEITVNKIGPALAAGNTMVVKPAPDTPLNATRLGRLVAEQTDIPPGVLNVVTSSDHRVGQATVEDPRVDLVSFTGSTSVGRHLMEVGAKTLKRLFLELGGKSVNLVLDDADFESVLPGTAAVCTHAGQGCAIPTRLLLPRSRYDEGVEMVRAAFENVPYGDPTDPNNLMGPLINPTQRERVLGYIEQGKQQGATLAVGGGTPDHLDRGYFVEPTLFVDVDNSMTIAQEEIFGPVLVVIPYADDDDAVRIANDSMYGLSGSVSGTDPDRALDLARRIRTGTLSVNGGVWYNAASPFGGYKQSGIGRQCGLEGFEQYLEVKTLGLPA